MSRFVRSALLIAAAWAGAACGTSEVPAKQLADSEAAIRAAQELGAEDNPEAALHLERARERVELARRASREGDSEQAARLLQQAEIDAELAVALTRRQQAAARADRARQQLDTLTE